MSGKSYPFPCPEWFMRIWNLGALTLGSDLDLVLILATDLTVIGGRGAQPCSDESKTYLRRQVGKRAKQLGSCSSFRCVCACTHACTYGHIRGCPKLHRQKLGDVQVKEVGWWGTHTPSCCKLLPFLLGERYRKQWLAAGAGGRVVCEGKLHFQARFGSHTEQRVRCDFSEEK